MCVHKILEEKKGVVFGVFSASAAFRFGEFVISLSENAPDTPGGICAAPLPLEKFRQWMGQAVIFENGRLEIGGGLWFVDLSRSSIWPGQKVSVTRTSGAEVRKALSLTLEVLAKEKRDDGFSLIVNDIFPAARREAVPKSIKKDFFSAAAASITELKKSFASGDPVSAQNAAKRLIGFGAGLTPSGDDFLTGLCVVFESVVLRGTEETICETFPENLRNIPVGLTNPYAWTYLAAAFSGYAPSLVNEAIRELLSDAPSLRAVYELAKIGGTSGVDMLTGIAAGFEILLALPITNIR